ncbi:hypothetical protein QUF58_13195 [Anaerolineales bacterium HSG24]|nr:hypothetical protein [Anaerolineales bacterium HSG24]
MLKPVSNKDNTRLYYFVARLILVLGILQFIAQTSLLLNGIGYITSWLTIDDTYYYLQTAWNFKEFGFPTFDGINPTNGVQLLWFWIILLLAWGSPTKIFLLYTTIIVVALLNTLCYWPIWQIGRLSGRPFLTLGLVGLWALLSFGSNAYMIAMENSLHAFIFWLLIWQVYSFLINVHSIKTLLLLTILCILNAWTRLDAGLFSAILYMYCIYVFLRHQSPPRLSRNNLKYIVPSVLLVLGLLIQLLTFKVMGGSYIPVSALIKLTVSDFVKQSSVEILTSLAMPPMLRSPLTAPLGIVSILFVGWHLFFTKYSYLNSSRVLRGLWGCLLVGAMGQLFAIAQTKVFFNWYLSPSFVFWIITFAIFLDSIEFFAVRYFAHKSIRYAFIGLMVILLLISPVQFGRRLTRNLSSNGHGLYTTRYNMALWMQTNLPANSVCASWNAGQLGYFSNCRVINLDGLINSAEYYDHVLLGKVSLFEYFKENNVSYLVDQTNALERNAPNLLQLPLVTNFPIDGTGNAVAIWRIYQQ